MKTLLSKIAQGILIVTIVYAGSFVLMEESSEKTEKTESSEEALQHIQTSSAFVYSKRIKKEHQQSSRGLFKNTLNQENLSAEGNFNIAFIYTTSFLDFHI